MFCQVSEPAGHDTHGVQGLEQADVSGLSLVCMCTHAWDNVCVWQCCLSCKSPNSLPLAKISKKLKRKFSSFNTFDTFSLCHAVILFNGFHSILNGLPWLSRHGASQSFNISIYFTKLTLRNLSHYICLFRSMLLKENKRSKLLLLSAAQVSNWLDVVSLLGFPVLKVGDNYGSKKADYQSRLTASHQTEVLAPFYLLKHSRSEDELRNPHFGDPADFPPNFCLSVWAF